MESSQQLISSIRIINVLLEERTHGRSRTTSQEDSHISIHKLVLSIRFLPEAFR
jgi:hypothetical protein